MAEITVREAMHIEVDGAVVNITVGLTDEYGRRVTSVMINPDDESRGGDGEGRMWFRRGARIIRHAHCRHCGKIVGPMLGRWEHLGPPLRWHCAGDTGPTAAPAPEPTAGPS